ncbi:hypothetical protein CRG98_047481, partial [Punica granatum]
PVEELDQVGVLEIGRLDMGRSRLGGNSADPYRVHIAGAASGIAASDEGRRLVEVLGGGFELRREREGLGQEVEGPE